MPEVGNIAVTPNPPGLGPIKGNLRHYQVSFNTIITQRNLVYRQYCLLPAPKDL